MKKYESVTFGCAFSSKNAFNNKLQQLLNEYARDGWRLHSFQVCGSSASICVVVFEKDSI